MAKYGKALVNGRFRNLRWFEATFPNGLVVDLRKPIPETYFPDSVIQTGDGYRPPLQFNAMRRSVQQRLGWLSGLSWLALASGIAACFSFVSGVTFSFVVQGFTVSLFGLGFIGIFGSMILSSLNTKYVYRFRELKTDYALQQVEAHNVVAFTHWVESSYGVKVEDVSSEYRLQSLASSPSSFDSIKFGGQKFKTSVKNGRLFLTEGEDTQDVNPLNRPAEGILNSPAIEMPKTAFNNDFLFTGESSVIWLSVNDKLDVLKKQKLVVEDRHVVSRVAKDLTEVVTGMRQLSALNISEVPSDVLAVLQGLDQELQQVLERQVDVVLKGFSQQAAWVDARKKHLEVKSDNNLL